MTQSSKDRRVLILGGSCALALGLAEAIVLKGCYPILSYRRDSARTRIEKLLSAYAGRYACFKLDLDSADAAAYVEETLDPGIESLVDFAQGDLEGLVATADKAIVHRYFEANIANRAGIIQQVCRHMVARRRGRMVYVSSVAAGRPNPGQGFYAAAKQACEALYRNVGLEFAALGITTVTLRPGYVDAGRGHRYLEKKAESALDKVPLGRALKTEEVVNTIMFLLSDNAVGFNATVLTMDGGLSAGK